MTQKKSLSPKDAEWAKAKKLCRLNTEDIRMAKELGFKPKSLIKNIPPKGDSWKAPVKEWIRDLYSERFGASAHKEKPLFPKSTSTLAVTQNKKQNQPDDFWVPDEDYLHAIEMDENPMIPERLEFDREDLPF